MQRKLMNSTINTESSVVKTQQVCVICCSLMSVSSGSVSRGCIVHK